MLCLLQSIYFIKLQISIHNMNNSILTNKKTSFRVFSYIKLRVLILLSLIVVTSSCATYYEKTVAFNNEFAQGNLNQAKKILDKDKKNQKNKNRILFLMNKGTVCQMMGQYEESNVYFIEADLIIEE